MGSLGNKATYNAYYGDFRGVDFSSDHTQVHKQRLAYAVNMYKDYQSGQGQALETVPGFRRRVNLPDAPTIYGIHKIDVKNGENRETRVLIHAGNKLYHWHNYPLSINVEFKENLTLPEESGQMGEIRTFNIPMGKNVYAVRAVSLINGKDILSYRYDRESSVLIIESSELYMNDRLDITYVEGEPTDAIFEGLNKRKSQSFIFNNRLYLIDGKNYLVYDGSVVKSALDGAYIPTTYINIIPAGENADIGKEYEQRNMLQPRFKHTFIADGVTTEFYMNENQLEEICEVKLYGEVTTEYSADLAAGKITFNSPPQKPEDKGFTEFYAGIEVTAKRTFTSVSGVTEQRDNIYELITECTIACIFDNRVFFSGNPAYPNHVFYCGRNITGYVDPTYFGVYNYMQDGVGITPITGIIPVADSLMVLKGDTQQDGSVFFHTPQQTGENLTPVIYPSTQGLNGIGCLGACINFLDDPIFVSKLGVEGVGQLSVRYERAIEHRSSLVDAKLINVKLEEAMLEEWNGYLVLLVDGKIYLADSRQKYTSDLGTPQYEWYYLEGIGTYEGQYPEYRYSSYQNDEIAGMQVKWCKRCRKKALDCECGDHDEWISLPLKLADAVYDYKTDKTEDLTDTIANPPDFEGRTDNTVYTDVVAVPYETENEDGEPITDYYYVIADYVIHEVRDFETEEIVDYEALLCEGKGNKVGGVFHPASTVKTMDSNLFFGTGEGVICSFNFDMRDQDGLIAPRYYNFDERIIVSGCATRMDNCDIPHLMKTTVKKSTVIKTKAMQTSAVKIRVRTNKKFYNQIARINSTMFSFDSVDFSDFSFITLEQSLFSIKEKEKKWVEKQYYVYSDEYMKPFALFYLCYRYIIAGRYKD